VQTADQICVLVQKGKKSENRKYMKSLTSSTIEERLLKISPKTTTAIFLLDKVTTLYLTASINQVFLHEM